MAADRIGSLLAVASPGKEELIILVHHGCQDVHHELVDACLGRLFLSEKVDVVVTGFVQEKVTHPDRIARRGQVIVVVKVTDAHEQRVALPESTAMAEKLAQ